MSLTYLYNKLENMDTREQYSYIKNVFLNFQIRPKFDIDEIFKDSSGKQSKGKNPLGYLVMHLSIKQLQQLVPEYLVELCNGDTFNKHDWTIMSVIEDAMCSYYQDAYSFIDIDKSEMCNVFNFGVGKYSPWSFLTLNKYLLVPALFRHLYKYYYISKVDEETGLSHLAHAACNIRMMQLIDNRSKTDES